MEQADMVTNVYLRECFLYITLIKEAYSLKDKAAITLHMLSAPWRCFLRLIGRQYNRPLIREVTIRNIDGTFFCGRSFTSCKAVCSFYEKDMKPFFDINEGVFIDVGAHIGKYTIRLANRLGDRGEVIAVEPELYNFITLEKNVNLNGLTNVHLLNAACSDSDVKISLYAMGDYTTLHSTCKHKATGEITVEALKLDTIVSQLNVKQVDLVKIDVEGAEIDVIRGSRQILHRYHPRVLFEAWNETHLREMEVLLAEYSYRIKQINSENYLAY